MTRGCQLAALLQQTQQTYRSIKQPWVGLAYSSTLLLELAQTLEVISLAKMTKTQKKNALMAIASKAFKLVEHNVMSINDYAKINTIVQKSIKKL